MKTLIVAFDGLDSELVDEFGLENLVQEETGEINNTAGMSGIMTSELFASFVTGETYESHGAKGLQYYTRGLLGKLLKKVFTNSLLMNNIRGLTRLQEVLLSLFDVRRVRYGKEKLKTDTIFDRVENSRAMFVPGYNPDLFWKTKCESNPLEYGYDSDRYLKFWDNRSYEHRKKSLFSEISFMSRPLLMCHFHRVDIHQHVYGDKEAGTYDQDRLYKLYKETDELAGEIKEKALKSGYERIIFMSDHGLPAEDTAHNKNAFYSCNSEIFPDKTPKITEFYDLLLEDLAK